MKMKVGGASALAAVVLAVFAGPTGAIDIHASQIEDVGKRIGKATAYIALCPLRAAGDPLHDAMDWLIEHGKIRQAAPSISAEQNATIAAAMPVTVSEICAKASAAFGTNGYDGVNWLVAKNGEFMDVRDLLNARHDHSIFDPFRKKIWVLANLVDAQRRCPDLAVIGNLDTYVAPFELQDVYRGWLRNTFFAEQMRVELSIERGKGGDEEVCSGYLYAFGPQGADEPGMIARE